MIVEEIVSVEAHKNMVLEVKSGRTTRSGRLEIYSLVVSRSLNAEVTTRYPVKGGDVSDQKTLNQSRRVEINF